MAEAKRRDVRPDEEGSRWRSRWVASAAAKADRLAHWQLVDDLYQAKHWQGKRASWRPDPVLNYTFHVTEDHRAQLSQLQPEPTFRPRRPMDERKSNTFREVVKYGWSARNVADTMDLGNLGFLLKGTVLYQVYWDPSIVGGAPEPIELMQPVMGPGGQPLVGPTGMPLMRPLMQAAGNVFAGDWNCRLVDPAHFFVDPGLSSPDLQEAAWCGVGELKLLSSVRARYGKSLGDMSAAQADVLQQGYVRASTQYTQADDPYVYVFEGYERLPADPARRNAGYSMNLRKVVLVNWQVVDVQEYWYKHGRYPFVEQHNYSIPGQFWALGDPQQYIALERLVRKLYELVGLSALLTAAPQKVLHPLAGILPTSVTSEPGKVYLPGPGYAGPLEGVLRVLEQGELPAYVIQFLEMVKGDIQAITGMFNGLPPGVTAASAVIAVFERLAARLKRKAMSTGKAARGIVEQVAGLVTEFYTEERVFRLTAPIDGVPWAVFRGSDFDGIEMDIDVDISASAPLSKAVLAEQAGAAYKQGAITASEYLTATDFPFKEIIESVKQREQQAQQQQRAQAALMQGAAPGGGAPGPVDGDRLPPGINLEGATPGARSLILNKVGDAGRV